MISTTNAIKSSRIISAPPSMVPVQQNRDRHPEVPKGRAPPNCVDKTESIQSRAATQSVVRAGTIVKSPATTVAWGSHQATKLVRVLPTQSLEVSSDFGVQHGATPSWTGGHGTEPYGTENATTTRKRLQSLSAALTVVKEHAGVRWHLLGRLVPTLRACDCRLEPRHHAT